MGFLLFLIFLAFTVWSIWRSIATLFSGGDRSILPKVEAEFRQLVVASERPEFCFDGRSAQIVKETEEGMTHGDGDYVLLRVFRYARNAHGEYFFFISDGSGKPYFKHIPQQNARLILGDRYIAPPAGPQT